MKIIQKFIKKPMIFFLLISLCSFGLTSAVEAQAIARAGLLEDMEIRPGVEVEIPIDIEDVVDLYGIDIELKFDPEFWEFRDADTRREGIQPATGTFLDPGMTLFNIIEPEEGRIHLVLSQVNPSVGKSGKGNILVLYATALKTGTTSFEVSKVELSTRDGIGIEVEGVDGEVRIANEAPEVVATSIPVTDPTQIIIIPTYIPPTATPVPTSTPRPTVEAQAAENSQTTEEQAVKQTETASDEEELQAEVSAEVQSAQAAGDDDLTGNGEELGLSKEGEGDSKTGIWVGISILAVVLAAVGFFMYNKKKSSSTKEE